MLRACVTVAEYEKLAAEFNPVKFDATQVFADLETGKVARSVLDIV